jgi:hypothetical protein
LLQAEQEELPFEDIGTLVVRFWEQLPPVVILEAADRILDHAKAEAGAGHSPFNFASSHGSASFGSAYELRLFQFLPVIQDLDPSRAQQLLRENPKTKSVLEQYPQGMRSLDSRFTSAPATNANLPISLHLAGPNFIPRGIQETGGNRKTKKSHL